MNDEIDLEDAAPWLVILLTLIGVGLRVLLLTAKGMSLDETVNIWLASHNIAEMLPWMARIDPQPPLYTFLLHYWIGLKGDGTYSVRLLSVLFGAGRIPIIYLIGKRLAGAVVGLVAAVMLTVSPFHIYYAQEASMATLLTFNAAVATYALVRLLTDPRSSRPTGSQVREYVLAWRRPGPVVPDSEGNPSPQNQSRLRRPFFQSITTDLTWIVFIVFSAATLLSHNTALFFFIATNLFVLALMLFKSREPLTWQAPAFKSWGIAQVAIVLLWMAGILPVLRQPGIVPQSSLAAEPTWNAVVQMLRSFLTTSAPIPAIATGISILYGLILVLGLVYYRKKVARLLFLAGLFVIPLLGEVIVNIWRPVSLEQTLIWTTIPLFLVLAAGAAQLKYRFLILIVLGIIGTNNLFSASDYFRFYQKEDWNTAARDVAGNVQKDDLVLFNSNMGEIPFDYYFKPYKDYYSLQVEEHGVPLDLFESGIAAPRMTSEDLPGFTSVLSGHKRVWLVYYHDASTDPMGLLPQTLAARMKLIEKDDFYGGQVQLYGNP